MKRIAFVAALIAVSACNSAAKEQARMDSIKADSTAKAAAAQMEMKRVADSTKMADSVKMAATKTKMKAAPTKAAPTKTKAAATKTKTTTKK